MLPHGATPSVSDDSFCKLEESAPHSIFVNTRYTIGDEEKRCCLLRHLRAFRIGVRVDGNRTALIAEKEFSTAKPFSAIAYE